MAEEKKQSFLKGAAVLSVATIVVKLVGLGFSIPLANVLGEQAMNYFGAAYEMFALFNAAATAGMPVAVSRMVSSAYASGRKKQADKIFTVAVSCFFVLGLVCSLLMFIFAGQLAAFLNVPGAKYSIQALAPTVFFCAVMSAVRGYFQGRSNMVPTAVSQVIEAISKLAIGLSLAFYIHRTFKDGELSSAAAVAGVSASALLGVIFSLWCKIRQKGKDKKSSAGDDAGDSLVDSGRSILSTLVRFAVPITIGACFIHVLNIIDMKTVMYCLKNLEGFSADYAESLYGIWLNTVKIYDLPGAIIIPLSTSVLPVLTAAYTRKNQEDVRRTAASAMRMTFLIAVPCAVGLAIFAKPIASVFYRRELSIEGVGMLLPMVAVSVIFNGLLYTTNAVIQAMGNTKRPVVHMAVGGLVKIVLNYTLVSIPAINIKGVAISTVASNLVVAVLNVMFIYKLIPKVQRVRSMVLPIVPAAALMGGGSYLVYFGLTKLLNVLGLVNSITMLLVLVFAIVIAVVVYFASAVWFGAIRTEEMKMIPKGDMIIRKFKLQETGKHLRQD